MTARGIHLADAPFDQIHGIASHVSGRGQGQSSMLADGSSLTGLHTSAFSRLKERLNNLWLWTVQKWPTVFESDFWMILAFFPFLVWHSPPMHMLTIKGHAFYDTIYFYFRIPLSFTFFG